MKYLITVIIIAFVSLPVYALNKTGNVRISGNANFLNDGDTVELKVYKYGILNFEPLFQENFTSKAYNHCFRFKFNSANYPQYINLKFKGHRDVDFVYYVVEPGQEINITYSDGNVSFKGKKSAGFKVQYEIRQMEQGLKKVHDFNEFSLGRAFSLIDSGCMVKLTYIKERKRELSTLMFQFLSSETRASALWTKYYFLNSYGENYIDSADNPYFKHFTAYLNDGKHHLTKILPHAKMMVYSNFYIQYILERYKADHSLKNNQPFNLKNCYTDLTRHYGGILREQLAISLLSNVRQFPDDLSACIDDALSWLKNEDYKKTLFKLKQSRLNGSTAYNFSLTDVNGLKRKFSEFKNKVLVIDFWYTGCGNCRELAPFMSAIEKRFSGKQVTFIGVSVDTDKNKWIKSISSGVYVSPEITNLYTAGMGSQHPVIKHYQINDYPTILIITPAGKILNVSKDPRVDGGSGLEAQISQCLIQ